ncbi:hypothetical protein D3C72_2048900 [compost metagenome]
MKDLPVHLEALRDFAELQLKGLHPGLQLRQIKLDSHKEHSAGRIHRILVRLHDIRPVFMQKTRYRRYDARSVRTGDQHPRTVGIQLLRSGLFSFHMQFHESCSILSLSVRSYV